MTESDHERLVGLLAAHERGALGSEDELALRTLITRDPEAAAEAGWDEVIDRLLTYACTSDLGEEEFTRGVAARITAENRGEGFVRRVTQASRRLRVRPHREPAAKGWMPLGLAAACAVLFLLAVAFKDGRTPARRSEQAAPLRVAEIDSPKMESHPLAPRKPELRLEAPAPMGVAKLPQDLRVRESQPPQVPDPEPQPEREVPAVRDSGKTTVAAVGTVERVEGSASILTESGRGPAREGVVLLAGQGLETDLTRGKITVRLNDGTRLDLDEDTVLRIGEGGKRLSLTKGTLQAEVTKQPRGSALVFETPNGDATVLGTILRLAVVRGTTRLEVLEGKVRLTGENAKFVDVSAGQFALAAAGTELKAKPIPDPRITEGLRALYIFEEGKGRVIRDVSGVGTPLHLVAKDENDLTWIPGGGLSLRSTTLVASSGPATKIVSACRSSRAITVEAWIKPAQVEKGTLRYIAALSGSRKESLAFGLGLHADIGNGPTTYRAYLTTPKTAPTSDLMPDLESSPIVPNLAHIVFTRFPSGLATLYVDGQEKASGTVDGDFSNWNDLRVMVGDYSLEGVRPWLGDFYLLAFYNRALKPEEVAQNFAAGKRKYSAKK